MAAIDIKQFVKDNLNRHVFFNESVKAFNDLNNHYIGLYDTDLIESRRPSESDTIKKYRKKIFQSKTHAPFNKVVASLMKIRKSSTLAMVCHLSLQMAIGEEDI